MVATDTSLISQLWRYPFKSMGGECISRTVISQTGVLGDRRWAVRKVDQTGNAKQFPSLMNMMAHYPSEPTPKKIPAPVLTLPDGSTVIADHTSTASRLSEVLDSEVSVEMVRPASDLEFYRRMSKRSLDETRAILGLVDDEPLPDVSGFPMSVATFQNPPGTFFDCFSLLLMTDASLKTLQSAAPESEIDVRRFRPNLVLETSATGYPEQSWAGRRVRIGSCELQLTVPCPRCVMTTHGFADLPRDTSIMRTLVRECRHELGIYADVITPGEIRLGDTLTWMD